MNKKKKILCTLRQNHYDSRKNDCSFFNSFFRAIFTCSIVYFWLFIGTCSISVRFLSKSLSSVSLFPFVSLGLSAWTVIVQPPSFVSVVEHSRSAEDETMCCRSSQDVSGNPPILCINQAITSRLTQAPGPPLSSRQHAASPFSVSGPFSISVFRSRKFRRSCTVLQLLGRDEGPVSSKENSASS